VLLVWVAIGPSAQFRRPTDDRSNAKPAPYVAPGNSISDRQMPEWTNTGARLRVNRIVLCRRLASFESRTRAVHSEAMPPNIGCMTTEGRSGWHATSSAAIHPRNIG
jgi:hypothetical protein